MLLLVDSAMNWIIGSNPLPLVRLTHWIHIVAWPCGHCQMIPNAFPNPVVNSCPVTGCDHYPFHWSTSSQFSDFDPSPGSERHRFTGVGTCWDHNPSGKGEGVLELVGRCQAGEVWQSPLPGAADGCIKTEQQDVRWNRTPISSIKTSANSVCRRWGTTIGPNVTPLFNFVTSMKTSVSRDRVFATIVIFKLIIKR
jgi:hypothetical protein